MFSAKQRVKHIYAHIKLSDGRELDGKFLTVETADLIMTLNGEGKFAVFVTHHGDTKLITKSSIVEANEKIIAKVRPLPASNDNGFDPHKILGVDPGMSFALIESQYNKLARRYHSARYTHEEMPQEITEYAVSMSEQIEQAYQALVADKQTCDQKVAI